MAADVKVRLRSIGFVCVRFRRDVEGRDTGRRRGFNTYFDGVFLSLFFEKFEVTRLCLNLFV